ncbi:unnamed protein product [Prunus armeniaca]
MEKSILAPCMYIYSFEAFRKEKLYMLECYSHLTQLYGEKEKEHICLPMRNNWKTYAPYFCSIFLLHKTKREHLCHYLTHHVKIKNQLNASDLTLPAFAQCICFAGHGIHTLTNK